MDRLRDEYETYDFHNYNYNTTGYDTRSVLSALLNVTYSYGKSKISLKNLYNNDFVNGFALRNGTNTVNQGYFFDYKSQNTEAASNGVGSSVLEGLHSLKKNWTIDWNTSFRYNLSLAARSTHHDICDRPQYHGLRYKIEQHKFAGHRRCGTHLFFT